MADGLDGVVGRRERVIANRESELGWGEEREYWAGDFRKSRRKSNRVSPSEGARPCIFAGTFYLQHTVMRVVHDQSCSSPAKNFTHFATPFFVFFTLPPVFSIFFQKQ